MSLFGSGRREACVAGAILVLLAVGTQSRMLLGLVEPLPQVGEGAANAEIVLPALADAAAVVQNGELPLWNPFARFGEPFAASGVQPLYPGYWPLIFAGAAALPWVFALHSALACVFMFRWLRSLPATRYSAFLGAAAYGSGVFFQAQLQRLPEAAAAAWLPLAFEGLWRLTRPGRNPAYAALAALGFAVMFGTGARALPPLAVGAGAVFAGVNLFRLPRADRGTVVRHLAVVVVGAFLLAAPVWINALQHADSLIFGQGPPGSKLVARDTLLAALNVLPAPAPSVRQPAVGTLELALFPGTVMLVMLVLSLVRPSPAQPRWAWFALAGLGVLAASEGPWSGILHDWLGLDGDRPGSPLLLFQLAVLVLACLGLDGFLEAPFRRKFMATVLGIASAVLGLGGLALALLRPAALVAWFAADPTDAGSRALAGEALAAALTPTALALIALGGVLASWRGLGILRFKIALSAIAFTELLYLAWMTAPARAVPQSLDIVGAGTARILATDQASLERLHRSRAPAQRINRSGDAVLQRTQEFLAHAAPGALQPGARIHGAPTPIEQLAPRLAALGQIDVLLGDAAPPAMPGTEPAPRPASEWARVSFQPRHVADRSAALQALGGLEAGSVILEAPATELMARAPNQPAKVKVLERRTQRVRLQVDVGQGRGYLVIADAFAPGWQATIDGETAPLHAADVAFRAIAIPEGEHEVVLRYAPWSVRFGPPLAGLGAVVCIAWLITVRRRRRPAV